MFIASCPAKQKPGHERAPARRRHDHGILQGVLGDPEPGLRFGNSPTASALLCLMSEIPSDQQAAFGRSRRP